MNIQPLKEQPIVGEVKKTSDEWYKELYPTGEFIMTQTGGIVEITTIPISKRRLQ